MASYDSLYGISNIADYDLSQIVIGSYINHVDWGLLNVGAFSNVYKSGVNINNTNLSLLRLSNDRDFTAGCVWDTFHKNLVWESGVVRPTRPINISGVYVNNTFQPLSSTIKVDYTNGRVIFTSPIPVTSVVNMEYSYKTISVTEAKNNPLLREIQFRVFNPSANQFSQLSSGDYAKSVQARNQLPLIGVEGPVNVQSEPWELGNKVKKMNITIIFHILAEDDVWVRKLVTTLANQKETSIFLMDFNSIARSGMFALDYYGFKNPNALTYPDLIAHDEYKFAKAHMISADGTDGKWISANLYHGSVRSVIETLY